jgi:energy-converting hydrogenase Eha subunit B
VYITIKSVYYKGLTFSPCVSPLSAGWHGELTVKTMISLSMLRAVECNCRIFLLQLVLSLFHIMGVVVQ